ncbi:MAG TPA: serine/threonine-protein kinase [Candidatus Thermoplasmatota archaeon]|nr:serine/threonine-protein kinase [Candidatus Thermoplasmatota archaeon]
MEISRLLVASAALAIGSAVAVATIGIVSLRGDRSRPRGAFPFGLFAIAWGIQVVLGNLAGTVIDDLGAATFLLLGFVTFFALSSYFLIEFAATQAAWSPAVSRLVRGAYAAAALATAGIIGVDRGLIFEGWSTFEGQLFAQWGPLYVPLIVAPHFGAFGLALATLWRSYRAAPTPRIAERSGVLLAGLSAYVAFAAGYYLLLYGAALGDPGAGTMMAVFAALSLFVAFLASSTMRYSTRTGATHERFLTLALLVPFVWGIIEGTAVTWAGVSFYSVGLWRLAGVAVIAYGLARWRIWDLPQRLERGLVSAGGAVTAAAGGAATYGAVQLASSGPVIPAVAAIAVAGLSFLPGLRLVERLVRRGPRAGPEEVEAELYGQRVEAYRAALEASLARGTLEEDADFLAALRERFRISPAEDRLLMHYARSSVLVPRGDATGAFERLRLLGEGGGGRTWLARDRVRDRLVVLKEPVERWQRDPAMRDAVLREARLAARVRHPNVVQVEAVVDVSPEPAPAGARDASRSEARGATRALPVIVMEYMDGGTLTDLLRAKGTLPPREAARVVLDLLRGIEAVHAAGIVHRDVKPSNILLAADGRACISDFGISLPVSSSRTVVEATGTSKAGTWAYMAPEVRAGGFTGDRRADVYSCAAILHECLYGGPPLPDAALVVRDDVPPALAAALSRGLAPRPEGRPVSARAFAEEIAKAVPA